MKRYSTPFKDSVIELVKRGHSANSLARQYNISVTTITRWIRKAKALDFIKNYNFDAKNYDYDTNPTKKDISYISSLSAQSANSSVNSETFITVSPNSSQSVSADRALSRSIASSFSASGLSSAKRSYSRILSSQSISQSLSTSISEAYSNTHSFIITSSSSSD